MKLFFITSLLVLSISVQSYAQDCNCNEEFIQIKNKIEKSYAGFRDKVTRKTKVEYDQHSKLTLDQSKLITKPAYCLDLINNWLTFFKDGHIQIGRNRIAKEKENIGLQRRIKDIDFFKLSDSDILTLQRSKGLTGIYWNEDSTFRIAVVKNKNSFRDYAGVIISSKLKEWTPGMVILEFKQNSDTIKGIEYDKYFIPISVSLQIKRNTLSKWQRENTKKGIPEVISKNVIDGKLLSENTLYMKIGSFNQNFAKDIDSLFKANKANLNKMPNLVLDLRNNGGGADFSYKPIVPYLYTNTIKLIGPDVLSTDDNIAGWEAVATTDGLSAGQKTSIHELTKKMEQNKGKMVSINEDRNLSIDSISLFPKKVIILINKHCGSSAEEFLLLAKQSTKVTLMGEHTAGILDYANIRGSEFSCMPYMIYWATSRSRRIDVGLGIDNIGIKPDVNLTEKEDWVKQAKHYVETHGK